MSRHKHAKGVLVAGQDFHASAVATHVQHVETTAIKAPRCHWCGGSHETMCPRVKSVEYHEGGIFIKRVEFWLPLPAQKQ